MRGKNKCKILKEIRQKIADENDIPYVTQECSYQGECAGTCPRCESELKYLERELARRSSLGKRVSVAALCVGISMAAAGCSQGGKGTQSNPNDDLAGAAERMESTYQSDDTVLSGEVAYPDVESSCDISDVSTSSGLPDEIRFETTGDVPMTEEDYAAFDT